MKKKILFFGLVALSLCLCLVGIYFKYITPKNYMVFVETFNHGVITVDSQNVRGDDEKFRIECKPGEEITININPERNEKAYYNLKKLYVNGVNVTDQVNMLQYKTTVNSKLNITAFFKKGKRPSNDTTVSNLDVNKPDIEKSANNEYLGSFASYDLSDPSVIYDAKSGYYYCFGSDNVVVKSKDLLNWTGRTTYFPSPDNAKSNTIMTFSAFPSVKKWAKTHGYGNDEAHSDVNSDRTPKSPEIVEIDGTYYLYFSLSKNEGANESAIFCVKTDNLSEAISEKQWDDVGLVISSCGQHSSSVVSEGERETFKAHYDDANAVHPSVISTQSGLFMVYGGYYGKEEFGGEIYLVELSSKTGLLKKESKFTTSGPVISTLHGDTTYKAGTLIAKPGKVPSMKKNSGSLVSGADIIYNKNAGYYYLFLTYGIEGLNSEIRVARSKSIEGPYVDYNGEEMAKYGKSSRNNQNSKGNQLLSGYSFTQSSKGSVAYSDIGRAALGSPNVIYTKGTWFVACQSQVYFDINGKIITGYENARANEALVEAYPALDVREMKFTEDGWPLAMNQMYSGEKANTKLKTSNLYGNWDVVVFDKNVKSEDYKENVRNLSAPLSLLKNATITSSDIKNKKKLNTENVIARSGDHYVITVNGVEFAIYPAILWDWELKEGSIVFSGIGADGSTIWGKKNASATLGLYTDTFYYVLSMCDDATKETYNKKIEKISSNPSQAQIDKMTNELVKILSSAA